MPDTPEPTPADIWNDIAVDLARRGRMASALAAMRRAVAMQPTDARLHSNWGNILRRAGQPGEALVQLTKARELDPFFVPALFNLGCWRMEAGCPDAAVQAIDECLLMGGTPEHVEDWRFARSTALLQAGRWKEGFAEYEVRLEKRDFHRYTLPMWDGSPLDGRTLLLHAEQGLGDTIMFARFFNDLVNRLSSGDGVVFVVQQQLHRLLGRSHALIRQAGEDVGHVDVHLPLMSLPHVLGIDEIDGAPYLLPSLNLGMTVPPGTRAKVGLVWQAKANWRTQTPDEMLHGKAKSMPLEVLLELTRLPGVALFGLQVNNSDIADLEAGHLVTDLQGSIHDFADLASFIDQLDCLVSVDTAPAHLAGALGKNVVVCLHHAGSWQWGTGDRSPWYDSARIVRQKEPGVWPIDAICAEVEKCLSKAT